MRALHNFYVIDRNTQKEHKLTENYIRFTNEFSDNNFNFFNIEKIPQDINKIWVLCYEPLTGFNCNVSIHEKKEWVLLESMKMHLSSANLFLIKK